MKVGKLFTQRLRIREELRAIRQGPLAVPAKKLGGPSFPLDDIVQVFHESYAIRSPLSNFHDIPW